MSDEKIILTPDEAIEILAPGETVHSFRQAGPVLFGVDHPRESVIDDIRDAKLLEIGGPGCQDMKHALVVHAPSGAYAFFETDMAKVAAMEAKLAARTMRGE